MGKLPIGEAQKWALIQDAVEGRQSTASCSVANGEVVFERTPIAKRAKPNLKLLAQILRSDEPLPAIAREWLANLFDPEGSSEFRVKELARRARGPGRTGHCHNWDAAAYAERRMEEGERADDPQARDLRPDKYAEAVRAAANKFRITQSAVKAALKARREGRKRLDSMHEG